MIKHITLILLVFISLAASGQNLHVSGIILDAQTKSPVPNVEILIDQSLYRSDVNGLFSLNHQAGKVMISIKSGDFSEMKFAFDLKSDTLLTLLYEKVVSIDEVTVVGNRISGFKKTERLEITKLTPSEISFFPGLGSSIDLLKELQLLPGVQSGGEGSSGLIVRGGQYDQNLFNLNGFPIYQPYHLFGFLSSIDPFMVSDMEIMKGGFPAKYGGKLSSVVNFNTETAVLDSVQTTIDAGILISGVATRFSPDTLTTVSLSGRIGTMLPLNKTLGKILPTFPFFNFFDVNLNASRKLNKNNDLSFTFYLNKDYIKKSDSFTNIDKGIKSTVNNIVKTGWHDILAGISWKNTRNDNLQIKTNLFFQNFLSESTVEYHGTKFDVIKVTEDAINTNSSQIAELGLTNDYQLKPGRHNINFGFFSYLRTVTPMVGTFLYANGELQNVTEEQKNTNLNKTLIESGIYFEDQYSLSEKTVLRPGVRLTLLAGSRSIYINPEPRLYISHKLNDELSVMGSYTMTTQSIQRVSSSNAMVVNDLWIPATSKIKPSKSHQGEIGVFFNPGTTFRYELNLYYKKMKDLSIYKQGASFAIYPDWQDNITSATGKSFGAEFMVQANLRRTFILLAYTLSKTTRQSPEVNNGQVFNYKYDKPHDLNITIGYRANKKLSLSCNWVFQSGNVISFYNRIIQEDYLKYTYIPYLDKANNIRLPYYHRLDLGLERKTITRWGKKILKLDIYNAYSKLNPWYLSYNSGQLEQVTLFPILPSLSYRIEF